MRFLVLKLKPRGQDVEVLMAVLGRMCTIRDQHTGKCDCAKPAFGPNQPIVLQLTDGLADLTNEDIAKIRELTAVARIHEGPKWPKEAGSARPRCAERPSPRAIVVTF